MSSPRTVIRTVGGIVDEVAQQTFEVAEAAVCVRGDGAAGMGCDRRRVVVGPAAPGGPQRGAVGSAGQGARTGGPVRLPALLAVAYPEDTRALTDLALARGPVASDTLKGVESPPET